MQEIASECSAAGSMVTPVATTAQSVDGNFETAFAACRLTVKHIMTESVWPVGVCKDHPTYWTAARQIYRQTTYGQCSFIDFQVLASATQGRQHCTAGTLLFVPQSDHCGVLDTSCQGPYMPSQVTSHCCIC